MKVEDDLGMGSPRIGYLLDTFGVAETFHG